MGDNAGIGGNTNPEQVKFDILRKGQFYELSNIEIRRLQETVHEDGTVPIGTYLFLEDFMGSIELGEALGDIQTKINKNIGQLVLVVRGSTAYSNEHFHKGLQHSINYELGKLVKKPIKFYAEGYLVSIPVANHVLFNEDLEAKPPYDYETDSINLKGEEFKCLNNKLPETISEFNSPSRETLRFFFNEKLIIYALTSLPQLSYMIKKGLSLDKIRKKLRPDKKIRKEIVKREEANLNYLLSRSS